MNGLNFSIRKQFGRMHKKPNPSRMLLYVRNFCYKNLQIKDKTMENNIPCNRILKTVLLAILFSTKWTSSQTDHKVANKFTAYWLREQLNRKKWSLTYEPKSCPPSFIEQTLLDTKDHIIINKLVPGNLTIQMPQIDKSTKQNKSVKVKGELIIWINLPKNVFGVFYPRTIEYIMFSVVYTTLKKKK